MSLSEKAFKAAYPIFELIKTHPFNQELINGSLSKRKFAYYIEQDGIYLQDFARCHTIIASKVPNQYMQNFINFANNSLIAEQDVVHNFFKKIFNFQETNHISPATLSYTSYLLRVCATEPVEVCIAAVLPCCWIYQELGLYSLKYSQPNNPFGKWIETYSSIEFTSSVEKAIQIFDEFAEKTTEEIRVKMLKAFHTSTCLEWHFWNDAYHIRTIEPLDHIQFTHSSLSTHTPSYIQNTN